jgi:peroxiredoxin
MGFREQLGGFRAEFARTALSGRVALYDARIEELRARFALEKAGGTGDAAAGFSLLDVRGNPVPLSGLSQRRPVIDTFYRGRWCAYCNIQLRVYQAVLRQMAALGVRLVAISPQLPDGSPTTADAKALIFEVQSDASNFVACRVLAALKSLQPV